MDVKIIAKDTSFHFRARGLIEQDGKFLIARGCGAECYHIPGGHVQVGEDTKQAICRELKEEIGCDVYVGNLFCVEEIFYNFNNQSCHSLALHYCIKPKNKITVQSKTNDLEFKWVTKDELKNIDLRPEPVKQLIVGSDINSCFKHFISRE